MSYEHCDVHDKNATNGCPDCHEEYLKVRALEIVEELTLDAGKEVERELLSKLKFVPKDQFFHETLKRAVALAAFRIAELESR